MNDYSEKKFSQLGMPISTAQSKLWKVFIFEELKLHGRNLCFRCNKEIKYPQDMSLDHKKAWLDSNNPKYLFWDKNNLTVSHKVCNIRRDYCRQGGEVIPHGTLSGYRYHKCNCPFCKEANNKHQREYRHRQIERAGVVTTNPLVLGVVG